LNKQAFTTLEYQHLLELIKRNAQTESGQRRVEALSPFDNVDDLQRALFALSECVTLRRRGVKWWFNGLTDLTEAIARLRVEGASLDPLAILQTARLCEQAMSARAAILRKRSRMNS
jgi:dsDNA-specific endonuclease/ATPase MutS2